MNELVNGSENIYAPVSVEQVAELQAAVAVIVAEADSVVVVDEPSYLGAMEYGSKIAKAETLIDNVLRPEATRRHAYHKIITDLIKKLGDPLAKAKSDIGKRARDWQRIEREKREAAARAEEDRKRKLIEEERIRQAESLAARGKAALADAVLEKPVEVERVQTVEVAKSDSASTRSKWTFEIVDAEAIPREYLMVDEKKIRGVVNAMKNATNIPGVRVWDEGTTAFKR